MFAVDLHAHTRFFHGRRSLGDLFDPYGFELLARAVDRRGLDGVATTNHDYAREFRDSRVTAIPGIEISTTHGHVLVVGPNPPTETVAREHTPREVIEMAREHDCAAILAHPFRKNGPIPDPDGCSFDAIEVNGKHPRTRARAERLADARDTPVVAGSDAHFPIEAGRAYTVIEAERLTPETVVEAICDGRVEPRVATGGVDRAVRRCYREIHRRKHGSSPPTVSDSRTERSRYNR